MKVRHRIVDRIVFFLIDRILCNVSIYFNIIYCVILKDSSFCQTFSLNHVISVRSENVTNKDKCDAKGRDP